MRLTAADVAELRALARGLPPRADALLQQLLVDVVEVELRARRERERMRYEEERLRDVLAHTRRLVRAPVPDDDVGALLAEIDDLLGVPRRAIGRGGR